LKYTGKTENREVNKSIKIRRKDMGSKGRKNVKKPKKPKEKKK